MEVFNYGGGALIKGEEGSRVGEIEVRSACWGGGIEATKGGKWIRCKGIWTNECGTYITLVHLSWCDWGFG